MEAKYSRLMHLGSLGRVRRSDVCFKEVGGHIVCTKESVKYLASTAAKTSSAQIPLIMDKILDLT